MSGALERLSCGGCFGSGVGTARGIIIGATFPVRLRPPAAAAATTNATAAATPDEEKEEEVEQHSADQPDGWGRVAAYTPRRFRVDFSDGRVVAVSEAALRAMIMKCRAF